MPAAYHDAILFDLDGTLIDSVRITCAIIDAMLAARGSDDRADPAIARAMDAVGGAAMIAAVLGRHCRDPDAEIAEFRARHAVVSTPSDLAFPGVTAALAGALYVPQVGIINPRLLSPEVSIEIAVWVALGGRGTLSGAVIGAVVISALKFWLTGFAPDLWPFILSLLVLVVVVRLPNGLTDLRLPRLQGVRHDR
jgi:hypothetical protein